MGRFTLWVNGSMELAQMPLLDNMCNLMFGTGHDQGGWKANICSAVTHAVHNILAFASTVKCSWHNSQNTIQQITFLQYAGWECLRGLGISRDELEVLLAVLNDGRVAVQM